VGAVIGSKGSYIRNMIRLSGANVKIASAEKDKSDATADRQVTVVGTPEAQWKVS